jgi:uncharacterized heparinase superfamily protein
VLAKRQTAEDCIAIEASHDGYARSFGLTHTRSIYLSTAGDGLEGEDSLSTAKGKVEDLKNVDYALRFHLHSTVRTRVLESGDAVELWTPQGQVWLFQAEGMNIAIEESISFASPEGVRGAEQIVIHANLEEQPSVNWTLYKSTPD